MADSVFILVVMLGAAGLGLVAYGLAAMVAPEWAHAHQGHLLSVAGLVPFILAVGRGVRAYQRLGVDIRLDNVRAWTGELANRAEALRQQAVEAIADTDDDEPDPEPSRRVAYTHALIRLFSAGDALGSFSQPKLARVIPSSDKWQELTDFYCEHPEGDPVLKRYAKNKGTDWHWNWTLERALLALATGELPLPPGPPPTINAYTPEKRAPEKPEKGSEVVVEGEVVRQ